MESLLGYSADSNVILNIGITLIKIVIFLTIAVFFQVIILRSLLVFREYRKNRFIDTWRPILMESVSHVPDDLPSFDKKFIQDFVAEWNNLYEKLGGPSHANLIEIARRLDTHRSAIKMLISSHTKIQLMGIITLGNMKTAGAWNILTSIAKSENTILSMAAYRALILINRDRALDELLPTLLKRLDWPPTMVARIIKDTDTLKVCNLIEKTCVTANEEQLINLVQYLNMLNCMCSHNVFSEILKNTKHSEKIISLTLSELNDPTAIDLVRGFTTHTNWNVRAQAAAALGNIGAEEDITLLFSLVSDEKWWVRYKAAKALAKLPYVNVKNLKGIQETHPNKMAKEILNQVIAEQNLS